MTKFITYYNLCPIPEPKDFLGISPDKEEGNVITTLGKNIIIIIKISTQKQIKSWSVLEKLSSKVVYDKNSEKYVAVFANKTIRCWDEDTKDVNKCKKLKFQKCIADLVVDENETFVLFSDGSCESLNVAIETRKAQSNSQQMELFSSLVFTNANVQKLSNGNRILTYFERNTKTGEYHLVRLPLQGEEIQPKRYNLKRGILEVHVAGAAVIEGDGIPVLLTIWSDKRIFLLSLADDSEPSRSPGNFVSMLTQLKVDTPLSVLGISKHFVAIYGANDGQEGASLLLYNTQYKVIKTKQVFKVYFDISQLWSIDEHILLAMGQNLSVVKYRVLKEVLSELVGTQVGHDYQTVVEDIHINEESFLEDCLQYSNEYEPFITKNNYSKLKEDKLIQADGNYVAYKNSTEFEKELNSLRQLNLHVDVVQVEEPLDDIQVSIMTNYNDNGFVCPEIQLIAKQLEKAGASEHEITEKLLTVLMKANLVTDIGVCLRRYNNISEKIISKTLRYLLQNLKSIPNSEEEKDDSAKQLTNGATKEHMEVDFKLETNASKESYIILDLLAEKYPKNSSPTQVIDVLNILLSCSFDAEAIAVHIRKDIDYSKILLILQHLYNMLLTPQLSLVEERPSLNPCSIDYELQIFRWFGVFLNSHYQKLALSKDVSLMEILFKWHEMFQSYKREIVELQTVAALLYNILERRKTFKEKNSSKWYSIEEVHLF
ncbi:nucleolar protein 11 [Calliphora vicina]|uniref:nucleolar protein 11 n=1 Tax=Calliphora vicina TaxID=7373 RepID=UPI00325BF2DD